VTVTDVTWPCGGFGEVDGERFFGMSAWMTEHIGGEVQTQVNRGASGQPLHLLLDTLQTCLAGEGTKDLLFVRLYLLNPVSQRIRPSVTWATSGWLRKTSGRALTMWTKLLMSRLRGRITDRKLLPLVRQ